MGSSGAPSAAATPAESVGVVAFFRHNAGPILNRFRPLIHIGNDKSAGDVDWTESLDSIGGTCRRGYRP